MKRQPLDDTFTDEHGIVQGTPRTPPNGPPITIVDNPMPNRRNANIGPGIFVQSIPATQPA